MYHVWPALAEGDDVIVKGEAVTRRGAMVKIYVLLSSLPLPRRSVCLLEVMIDFGGTLCKGGARLMEEPIQFVKEGLIQEFFDIFC